MSLDLDAALRQTTATSFQQDEIDRLLAGRLRMSPHPEWQLPDSPTWQEDPFHDRNWTFQFHMLRWLEPLRRAAAKGDDAAFSMWLRWVEDWISSNPPESPRSSWAWTDMSDGIRAQQLCSSAPMIAERRPDLLEWLERTIRVHAEHLADPRKMGNANHALHQQESLFVCGRVLGEDAYWQLAAERMSALLHEQYDEQGMNAEGATAYHYNNYLWWERALARFDMEKLSRPAGSDRHLHAPEGIAHATRPDGTLVPLGDTDTVDPKAIDHPAIAYVTSDGKDGSAPPTTTAVYGAGYVFARSGWGDPERPFSNHTYYSLRFGPSRRVHGHPDGGSLTFSSFGQNWVTDLGKFQYGTSVEREHVASRAAHSLLSIEGKKPRRGATVILTRSNFTPEFHDIELADDSFRGITLSRRVVYSASGEYLVVIDSVNSLLKITARQRWQLDPSVTATLDKNGATLAAGDSIGALRAIGGGADVESVRGQPSPFDGWVSRAWRSKEPATAISFLQTGTSLRFITVLSASRVARPSVRGAIGADESLSLSVHTDRGSESLTIRGATVAITPTRSET
jgi:hypothetical protein